MAIDATALIAPNGPLESAPKEDSNVFEARVAAYVDAAYADARVLAATDDATKDRMAKALASYHGLMADYRRMLREPLTVNVTEKGSHGYSTKQIDGIKALADEQLAEFNALIVVAPSTPAARQPVTVPFSVNWAGHVQC